MNSKHWVWIVVVLHLALAAAYAKQTPYRTEGTVIGQGGVHAKDIGAPDERQHVNYVTHLLSGKGFPVFDPHDPSLYESYQSHQPPLYYTVAAGWAKAFGLSDLTEARSGLPLRLLNALIGAFAVLGVWFLAWWGFESRAHALAAASIAGLLPMNVALSGAVSNDPLLIALCTWTLALCARGVRRGWDARTTVGVGIAMGLAFLTKTTAVALIPVAALACFMRPKDAKVPAFSPESWRRLAVVAGIAMAFGLPWWIRNQSLYGDPLAMNAFNQAFTGSAQASDLIQNLGGSKEYWIKAVGRGTMCSFFGVFGYWDVWLDLTTYYAMAGIAALLGLAWVATLLQDRDARPVHLLNGLLLFFVLAAFVRFNMQYFQAQGRYLLPAIGPIACGLGGGLVFVFRKRAEWAALALGAGLLALNLYVVRDLLPTEFAARVQTAERASLQR